MNHRGASLSIVRGSDLTDQRAPEDMLAFLFAREAQLTADLADVRRQLGQQRKLYSDAHSLRCYPGLDRLRDLFGPRKADEL